MSGPITKSRVALAAVLLLALAGVAFWLAQPDPRLVEARRLQERLASAETRRLPPAQQLELRDQSYAQMEQLSPAQQRVLQKERRRMLLEKIERYRDMTPAERLAYLDEEITQLAALRREREQAAGTQIAPNKSGKPARRQSAGGGGLGGAAGAGNGAAGAGGANDLEHVLKRELDASTPEMRALLSGYLKDMIDRWKSMGMLRAEAPDDLNALLAWMQ